MADNYFNHQELIKRTKLKFTQVFRMSARLYDRHVGLFYKKRVNNGMIDYLPIQINRKGQADNWGVLICFHATDEGRRYRLPIHFEVETKTGKGKLTDDQKENKEKCENLGIWWFENRDEMQLINDIIAMANQHQLIIGEINYGAWN